MILSATHPPLRELGNGIDRAVGPRVSREIRGAELSRLDEHAAQARGLRALDIRLRVIADHDDFASR